MAQWAGGCSTDEWDKGDRRMVCGMRRRIARAVSLERSEMQRGSTRSPCAVWTEPAPRCCVDGNTPTRTHISAVRGLMLMALEDPTVGRAPKQYSSLSAVSNTKS
eukprot:1725964-Prymnesium_polylepis.1